MDFSIILLKLVTAIGLTVVLIFWLVQEKRMSRADPNKSRHPKNVRRLIRPLMPIIGVIMILQVSGIISAPFTTNRQWVIVLFWVGHVLFWISVAVAIWARQTIGWNWAHAADFQILPGQQLVTWGPYAYVRHPMYSALLVMFIGVELLTTSWLILGAVPLIWFFIWQSKKEEAILMKAFPKEYREYSKRAGMLFPKMR